MANTFKKYTAEGIGTTEETIYSVPANTTTVVIGFILSNVLSQLVEVTSKVGATSLLTDIPVPAGSTLGVLDGKMVLEAGDAITVVSTMDLSVDSILSIMEIT